MKKTIFCIFLIVCGITNSYSQTNSLFKLKKPHIVLEGIKADYEIIFKSDSVQNSSVYLNDSIVQLKSKDGKYTFDYTADKRQNLSVTIGTQTSKIEINPIPLYLSILPPLIAIFMALFFKEVFSSLFMGLFSGSFIIYLFNQDSIFDAFFKSIFAIPDNYIIKSLTDPGHASVIIFSMLIGGMVHIITKNGGMQGVVDKLKRYASNSLLGQLITWFMGVIIFFDDYANTLVVGNTMRPVTDRLKISREKLAYLVDSTAAPMASIAIITTWIGIELSYIDSALIQLDIDKSAYSIFLHSLPTRFYPIFALVFILFLIFMRKDFGPMLKAEKLAKENLAAEEEEDNISIYPKARWYNAIIPISIIIFGTLAGLFYTGWNSELWNSENISLSKKLSEIIGNSDSYIALLWSSVSAVIVAVILSTSQRILSLKQSMDALLSGLKTMLTAVIILVMAWALALITKDLHTADFISNILISIKLSPELLPSITFLFSALVAFSTGSSWGTMAILYPLILPAAWSLSINAGLGIEESMDIFCISTSAILAGSVLGDHCSPISDTTILSSLASSCDHVQHVRTQFPYALTVGGISIVFGLLPAAYNIPYWILYILASIAMYLIIKVFGKRV
ncbi:MAG: Na+/H+ antiporter NhaC family protein [Marinifilaceae bacterium]|jgi:Na+/H+ antiporter NhaC|nr:Na+/H+ antiporter NhaC family protein [Marinifilaceae bacterium]